MSLLLTQAEQDAVLRARLAVPERALRSLMKRLTVLAAPLPLDQDASGSKTIGEAPGEDTMMKDGSAERAAEELELRGTQLVALKTDLAAYVASLVRSAKVARHTCTAEVQSYEEEAQQIQDEHEADTRRIEELKRELEDARRERGNKLLYDQVVERMGKMESRQGYAESLANLRSQIATLEKRNERLSSLSASSKDQFDQLVSQMTELGVSLRRVQPSGALGSDEDDIESDSESEAASETGEAPEDAATGASALGREKKSLNPTAATFLPGGPSSSSPSGGASTSERKRGSGEGAETRSARRAGASSTLIEDARQRRRGGTQTPLATSTRAPSVEEGEEEEGAV